jgi:hypothetical protein
MDFSTEGGTLNAYFDGGKINLIVVTLYGETGRSDEEYYYDDSGNLFFVLRKESRYGGPFGKTVSVREDRFYFREGELIQWLDNEKKRVPSDSAEYKRQEENLLEFSKTLAETAQLPGVKSSEPSASERSPVAEPLRSVLAEIKNQTNVPILLPSELPYTLAKQNIYATGEAVNGGYEISLISRPQCGANSCFIASFKAQRGGNMRHPEETDDDPQSEDKRVVLVNNTKAYYKPLTCGGSCSPPIIEWVSNGVLYTIQFEVEWRTNLTQSEEERLMVEVANSAIKHGAR